MDRIILPDRVFRRLVSVVYTEVVLETAARAALAEHPAAPLEAAAAAVASAELPAERAATPADRPPVAAALAVAQEDESIAADKAGGMMKALYKKSSRKNPGAFYDGNAGACVCFQGLLIRLMLVITG